jgi:hypothetical protein
MNKYELISDLKEHLDTYSQTFEDYNMTYNQVEMIYYYIKQLQQENKQLKDDWNKLKEYIRKTKLKEFEKSYGRRYGKTFTQAEVILCNMITNYMQELEKENDSNE